jgi:tripartite-type tricarboxylate transporter receptor subunit TctC
MTRNLNRRQAIAGLAALAGGGVLTAPGVVRAQAAWKPSGTITLIVPWPPGGSSDILARLAAPGASRILGQTVVIVNKSGATGSIGCTQVYDAKPDGSTLLVSVVDNTIYADVATTQYDPTKFVPVAPLAASPYVLLGRPDLPANNLQEFIALARKQTLNFANAGMGGSMHVLTVALGRAADIPHMQHVAYQGMAPALNAVMGGFTDATLTVTGGTMGYRGKLKYFGVTSAERIPALADIPTMIEQGLKFTGEAWMGYLAPPNTPAPIADALSKAFQEATAEPAYQAKVLELAMRQLSMTQPEFATYYAEETRKWSDIVHANGIKL